MKSGFVAGATGFTGRSIVEHLAARGAVSIAHVRPDSRRLEAWSERFAGLGASVDTTPWEDDAMAATLKRLRPTTVFATLGTTKRRARQAAAAGGDSSRETYEAVDYELTTLLRRACERAEHRPHFVYLSAVGAKEGSNNAYLEVRGRVERELREGDLPFTIIQPSFIVGDCDITRPGERVGATIADGAMSVLGALGAKKTRDRYRSITGDELARAMVACAFDASSVGRTITADELRG